VKHFYLPLEKELGNLQEKGLFRNLKIVEKKEGPYIWISGKRLLNLASNDYLGLAGRLSLKDLLPFLEEGDFGAGAARLLSGNHAYYEELETFLEELYGRPVLFFNSGYLANLAILTAFCGRHDGIFADKLVHASILDGAKLSGAKLFRFPHQDYEALEKLLFKKRATCKRALIVSESIFSMDGDKTDLKALLELKERFEALLFIDEAHAIGIRGRKGLGLAEEFGLGPEIDILLGTCGKALGSYGAFVVVSEKILKDYLINKARPFIFTTALPPIILAATKKALSLLRSLEEERKHLRTISLQMRKQLGLTENDTPIIPVIVGESKMALKLSQYLFEKGFYAPAIRPPTVPENTARLRLSLTAEHTFNLLDDLVQEIKSFLSKNS